VEASGADVVRAQLAIDEGAGRLGEVALVDRTSRVSESGLIYFKTLLEENASCHIAYRNGIAATVAGAEQLPPAERQVRGLDQSAVHTGLMVGGADVEVDGLTTRRERVPLLRGNEWQLD
jgi:aminopeptidase